MRQETLGTYWRYDMVPPPRFQDDLLKEGLAWLDTQAAGEPQYWLPALFSELSSRDVTPEEENQMTPWQELCFTICWEFGGSKAFIQVEYWNLKNWNPVGCFFHTYMWNSSERIVILIKAFIFCKDITVCFYPRPQAYLFIYYITFNLFKYLQTNALNV